MIKDPIAICYTVMTYHYFFMNVIILLPEKNCGNKWVTTNNREKEVRGYLIDAAIQRITSRFKFKTRF